MFITPGFAIFAVSLILAQIIGLVVLVKHNKRHSKGRLLREHTRFEDRTLFKKIPMESLNKIPPHENNHLKLNLLIFSSDMFITPGFAIFAVSLILAQIIGLVVLVKHNKRHSRQLMQKI
jgi:membrane-bound ClpP family serine protease